MAGDKHLELPDELEALLRRTLSIEPSAEFLPRVRERLGTQPRWLPSPWRLWLTGAAAAAVCVVAVGLSVMSDWPAPPQAPPAPAARVAPEVAITAPAQYVDAAVTTRARSRANRAPTRSPGAPASDLPVVVVDQRQRAALTAVMRLVGEGRLTDAAFARTTRPSMQPIREQVTPIGVVPLELNRTASGGVMQSDK